MARCGSIVVKGKLPVLEVASVSELSVVDFPEDGLPTRPIRGSRGMVEVDDEGEDEVGSGRE